LPAHDQHALTPPVTRCTHGGPQGLRVELRRIGRGPIDLLRRYAHRPQRGCGSRPGRQITQMRRQTGSEIWRYVVDRYLRRFSLSQSLIFLKEIANRIAADEQAGCVTIQRVPGVLQRLNVGRTVSRADFNQRQRFSCKAAELKLLDPVLTLACRACHDDAVL